MRVPEICEKLKPLVGNKAEKLHKLYLLEDYKGKAELEEAINLIRIQNLNENEILLPPPEVMSGDYPFGEIKYNGSNHETFYLHKRDLPRHIAIFGTTGSGKTNACYLFIANLINDNIPFLITDFKQNYRDLINTDIGKDIKIFTVGKDIAPFHFNPLMPPKGVDPQIYINKLIDVINHSHFVSYGVDHLLQTAIHAVYEECGVYSELVKTPTFNDVLEWMKKHPVSGRESLWKASALRTLHDLSFGPVGKVFNNNQSIDIPSFMNQQIVLELDALPQTTKTFLVESLLLQIYLYRINERKRDEQIRHMLILEEAHHLLLKKREESETITDIFLREIRETGQGVCLLDQSPSLISNTALSNTNTLIAMQLKHYDDISQISKALLLRNHEYFGMLKIGEAIVKTQYPQPFLIKFPLAQIKKGIVSDEAVKTHMIHDIAHSVSIASEPKGTDLSYSVKNREIRKPDKLHKEEAEFLKDIATHPLSGVSSRYKRMGLSVDKGNDIKISLIEKEYLKPVVLPTKTGKILLLEPTRKGKAFFKTSNINYLNGRIGGIVHEYWRMKVAYYYKDKGYKVKYEYPVSQGKTVDLVAEKDGQRTAIEIETGKSDFIGNIRKCLHFNEIICVATSSETEKQIKEKILNDNIEKGKVKVNNCKEYFMS